MAQRIADYLKNLKSDVPASVVVFLVALPLCLGIALGSGVPLFSGLIAGMVGGIVIGLLSGSQLSVSGPAAGLIAVVAVGVTKLPTFEAFLVAVVICGVLQIALGYLKAGVLGDYVPNSVIKGMLAAIGLVLILKQLPHLVGYDASFGGEESFRQPNQENTFSALLHAATGITPAAAGIGLLALAFQVFWVQFTAARQGFVKLLPAPLLVVLLGVGINEVLRRSGAGSGVQAPHLVNIPIAGSVREFFSFFTLPDWRFLANPEVWTLGVTLALVASLETLLSIEAVDDLDPYQRVTDKERELKAQGVGNVLCGLLGGLPMTSVIVRSSANVTAGAKTKMSAVYHGLLLLLCVALIPGVLNRIPKAALAAVLIYTGYKLAVPSLFRMYYKKGWDQFLPFVITIVAILFTDLLRGVAIGMVVGLYFVLHSNFKTAVSMVNDGNKYLFRLRKDVSFINKPFLKNQLERVPENSYVLMDTSQADFIDKDVVEVIEDFMIHAPLSNIHVELQKHPFKNQGFNEKLEVKPTRQRHLIRTPATTLAEVEA